VTTLQTQAPTVPNVYPTQSGAGAHPVYQPGGYSPCVESSDMSGAQQPSMMPASQNNPQMKQAHAMQSVRPTRLPNRPGAAYANQLIQQPPPVQEPISVNYMPDPSSIMMPSSGATSAQSNPPDVPPTAKRKLNETNMYGNGPPPYTIPAKMPLQSAGKIVKDARTAHVFLMSFSFSRCHATIPPESSDDATKQLHAKSPAAAATSRKLSNLWSRADVFGTLRDESNARKFSKVPILASTDTHV
jgi:hypothetical protein